MLFFLPPSLYKTNRFHVAVGLFSNRSQKTLKSGKNINDTLACGRRSCATSLFLPHFDVICDVLLNRRMATWNLFVKYSHYTSSTLVSNKYYPYSTCPNTMLARRSAIKRIIYVSTLHLNPLASPGRKFTKIAFWSDSVDWFDA